MNKWSWSSRFVLKITPLYTEQDDVEPATMRYHLHWITKQQQLLNVSALINASSMQSQTHLSHLPKEDTGVQCHLHTFMSIQQNTFRINWPTFIKPGINTTLFVSSTSFSRLIPYCQWWRFVRLTWQPAMLTLHGTLVERTEIMTGSRI